LTRTMIKQTSEPKAPAPYNSIPIAAIIVCFSVEVEQPLTMTGGLPKPYATPNHRVKV